MVDAVLSKISTYRQKGGHITAADIAIKSGSFHHVAGSTKLVIILPYWHAVPSRYAGYRSRLHAKGISTIYYDLEPHMLHAHVSQVTANFVEAADSIIDEVSAIRAEFDLPELEIHAFSLGNTLLGMIVHRLDNITTLRMIVPGDSLAACLWQGIATRHIRNSLESQGVTEARLVEAWQPMSLINSAAIMVQRVPNIYVTLARADKFIPYRRGKLFTDELERLGAKLHLQEWRMGHGATVARYIRTYRA